jgi:hypothetical protein
MTRATLAELHSFANKVRAAGGGNPIDALMPAVPQDTEQCLIAKNLNFNCEVKGTIGYDFPFGSWVMELTDREIRDRIAAALNLETAERNGDYCEPCAKFYAVLLPDEIGAIAAAFDDAADNLDSLVEAIDYDFNEKFGQWLGTAPLTPEQNEWLTATIENDLKYYSVERRNDIVEMIPMILDATAEARMIAQVAENGKIIL